MKTLFILIVSCILGVASAAGIYKWVDSQGVVHYGDEPGQSSAEKMGRLPGLSTYAPPPIKVEPDESATAETEEQAVSYRSIRIIKPENGETIRSNPGIVVVFIALEPPLGKTDHIRLMLDGKSVAGKYNKTVVQLDNVDRGEHQLSVAVHNNKGKQLKSSASHTFYLHKAQIIRKSPSR